MEGAGTRGASRPTRTDWTRACRSRCRRWRRRGGGRLDGLEVLYWVGCAAAFDARNQRVARAFATCLDAAGVSFAILGQEESCTGDPARRMGNDYVYQMLAMGNVETLNRYGMGEDDRDRLPALLQHDRQRVRPARRAVRGRPPRSSWRGSWRTAGWRRAGGCDADRDTAGGTVHDPCYLTRYNGVTSRSGTCSVPAGLEFARWRTAAEKRSAAAPAAGGCGWRRRAARASTPSGRARPSRPAPRPWRRRARSA